MDSSLISGSSAFHTLTPEKRILNNIRNIIIACNVAPYVGMHDGTSGFSNC